MARLAHTHRRRPVERRQQHRAAASPTLDLQIHFFALHTCIGTTQSLLTPYIGFLIKKETDGNLLMSLFVKRGRKPWNFFTWTTSDGWRPV